MQTTLADATGGAAAAAGDDDQSGGTSAGNSTNSGGSSGKSSQGKGGKSASTGGSAGTVSTSGGSGAVGGDVLVVPDGQGWVDPATNELGLQGGWYAYGDRYGAADCVTVGLHAPMDCSLVNNPSPELGFGFPNEGGAMCTDGVTMPILSCAAGVTTLGCPDRDYENMWGTGIGFDFNADRGEEGGALHAWNAIEHGIIGIAFDIDAIPAAQKLRIEFSMPLTNDEAEALDLPPGSTSDDDPQGSPYWGAISSYPPSPLVVGRNRILWNEVRHPTNHFAFDPSRVLSIHFHVPPHGYAGTDPAAYAFCVSNVTFLRDSDTGAGGAGGSGGSGGTDNGGVGGDSSPGGETGMGGSGGGECPINSLESFCAEFWCPTSLEEAVEQFDTDGICAAAGAEIQYSECGYTSILYSGGFSYATYQFDTETGELARAGIGSDAPFGPCDQSSYRSQTEMDDACGLRGRCAACTADGAEPPELECRLDCDCSDVEPGVDACIDPDSCYCYCNRLFETGNPP